MILSLSEGHDLIIPAFDLNAIMLLLLRKSHIRTI